MAKRPREIPLTVRKAGPDTSVVVSHIAKSEGSGDPEGPNPNHHLWLNGRLWWVAFTVHRGHQQERVRFSLGTDDVEVARERRDALFALYESAAQCRISLRILPRRASAARSQGRARRLRPEGCV